MEKKDYEDFVLQIREETGRFVAIVLETAASASSSGEPFTNPFGEKEIEEIRVFRGSGCRDLDLSPKKVRSRVDDLGGELFEAVFSGKVRRLWDQSLAGARGAGRGLRLRLIFEGSVLWEWPWEYLRDPDGEFLIWSSDISIVRSPRMPQAIPARFIQLPLRVLVVISQPSGLEGLDSEKEFEELEKSLKGLIESDQVELSRVESASLATLRHDLERPIHVLHFIGHGGFNPDLEQAFLHFERLDGQSHLVSGADLAGVLSRQPPPALVVLNACEGGRASKADPVGGVAQRLLEKGTPAVVAMQFRVSDEAALAFSQEFYRSLALGETLDRAVFEARHAMRFRQPQRSVEWGNPVLYLRGSQGKIFDVPEKPPRRLPVAAATLLLLLSLATGGYFLLPGKPKAAVPNPTQQTPPLDTSILVSEPPAEDLKVQESTTPMESTPEAIPVSKPEPKTHSDPGCPPIPKLDILFRRIEPGTFTMGAHHEKDAKPHKVSITTPFCMSEKEITRQQWLDVLHESPPSKYKKWSQQPVDAVSWERAQEFIRELRTKDPKAGFRLPTEAQWEYAARAGSTTKFSYGDDPSRFYLYGNCKSTGVNDRYDVTAPVGKFRPNAWGLYDMEGNVSEWVEDWYASYDLSTEADPTGPARGTLKVRRGGSFKIITENCSVAHRNKSLPDYKSDDVGFRIIRDVVP